MAEAKDKDDGLFVSEQDYLNGERTADVKHEYVDGRVYAMSGASKNHERIIINLSREFSIHLKSSSCEPFSSEVKIKTSTGKYRYPDFVVICEDTSKDEYYTESPVIVVEVLSRSTRKTDEQRKRLEYINIPTLKEYVLIEQDFVDIEVFRKSDDWRPTHYFLGDQVFFESINLTVAVEEIYQRVQNEDMDEFLASGSPANCD